MPQVRLLNRWQFKIKTGDYVKLHLTFRDSFVFADYWDRELIGTAAETQAPGRKCLINLINTADWTDVINAPTTFPASPYPTRIVTDNTIEMETDYDIVCNKGVPMTVTLLPATGSNRVRQISNINTGAVTVIPSGGVIDAETTQIVDQWENMVIKDIAAGIWKII